METAAHARPRIARAVKAKDPVAEREARRDYAAAKLSEIIRDTVAASPPLSESQVHELSALLSGSR